jgi:hypothetical protein
LGWLSIGGHVCLQASFVFMICQGVKREPMSAEAVPVLAVALRYTAMQVWECFIS